MFNWIKIRIELFLENRRMLKKLEAESKQYIAQMKAQKDKSQSLANSEMEVSIDWDKLNPKKMAKIQYDFQKVDLLNVESLKQSQEKLKLAQEETKNANSESCCSRSVVLNPKAKIRRITTTVPDIEEILKSDEIYTTLDGAPYVVCADDLEFLSTEELNQFKSLTNAMDERKREYFRISRENIALD